MLLGKHRCRYKYSRLFAVQNAFHYGSKGNLGFAVTHIPA